ERRCSTRGLPVGDRCTKSFPAGRPVTVGDPGACHDLAMSERDSDIQFAFFEDEPATTEAQTTRPARRGPRPPIRPPAGITPLLRLIGLVAFAILIVVLLVFAVQSCRGSQKRDTYENYMGDVDEVANQSEQIGRQLNNLLTDPAAKLADIRSRLSGLAQQQEQGV